ncbi:MAG TPA: FAD/NAD(P)-binding protein, partial [Candidatus Baltobacteraceae bacterium]
LLLDREAFGPGTAYAAPSRSHLMNGTARTMSAFEDDEQHLVRWLTDEPGHTLIPRSRFGEYVRDLLDDALARCPTLSRERAQIVDLVPRGGGYELVDCDGRMQYAATVVLALGNFAPTDEALPASLRSHPGYVANPWRFDASEIRGDVLCVGSGLTAMDVAVTLQERGFTGGLHVLSRRGLVPLVEDPFAEAPDAARFGLDVTSPYRLLRTMRRAARREAAHGRDWRPIVESIRATTPAIWSGWSLRERRQFLRHLEAYWSIHRYRVPAATARVWADLARSGRLTLHRGRVTTDLDVAHVINCTGPQSDYARIDDPLVRNLVRRGLIAPDALSMGIRATAEYAAIGRDGRPSQSLFAIGPPLRGERYESTAIPEIRRQAAALAEHLVAEPAVLTIAG